MPSSSLSSSPSSPLLIMAHGWSYDHHFWDKLLAGLATFRPLPPLLALDQGYHGTVFLPPLPHKPFWAIGHSAGVLDILVQLQQDEKARQYCLGIVSINGFACFAQKADFPQGIPVRFLQRMRRKLANASPQIIQEIIHDFRTMCGEKSDKREGEIHDASKMIFHAERLDIGLQRLENLDLRPFLPILAKAACPLYIMTGRDDPLSPARAGFGHWGQNQTAGREWCIEGGHLLPLFQSRNCAERLNNLLFSD